MKLLITGASGFIGTNFVQHYSNSDYQILNVDIQRPLNPLHQPHWAFGDIMDAPGLETILANFGPTHIIHMAARADCDENTTVEDGYAVNTVGTENVLRAIRKTPTVERVIVVSTQYVSGPSRLPIHDEDYFPHTVYGQSKVITEQLARKADLDCTWAVVRPTNVWGPWHYRYRSEAWRVINKGMYFHPGWKPVVRSYGYVGNVVWQMNEILTAPPDVVDHQVFYVGDRPIDIYHWVNAFSVALRQKPARRVPRYLLAPIGQFGDLFVKTGKNFPLTSSRFKNMISDYRVPIDNTFEAFGDPPYSLQEGVEETVAWLEHTGWE